MLKYNKTFVKRLKYLYLKNRTGPPGLRWAKIALHPFPPQTPRHATTRYATPRHALPRRLPRRATPGQSERSWVDFWSQHGTPNPRKSVKSGCQDAFRLGLHFWIDFWSIFAPNFDPRILQNHGFSFGKLSFFKKWPLEDNIDLDSILEANMPPKSTQNQSK